MFVTTIESHLGQTSSPIILLEGTRNVPPEKRQSLVALAQQLAQAFPHAVFRSGNALGADEAFAEGVASVPRTKLELILPTPGMGRGRRPIGARCIALNEVPDIERPRLALACVAATPDNHRLFRLYEHDQSGNPAYSKSLYLVRDALKVIGSPALNLAPATLAIFFIDESSPAGGGTGHTIRLCQQHHIPLFTQHHWLA